MNYFGKQQSEKEFSYYSSGSIFLLFYTTEFWPLAYNLSSPLSNKLSYGFKVGHFTTMYNLHFSNLSFEPVEASLTTTLSCDSN